MEKKKSGRKNVFIDDEAVTLSIKVPSKEKERFREIILALRIPYLLKIWYNYILIALNLKNLVIFVMLSS